MMRRRAQNHLILFAVFFWVVAACGLAAFLLSPAPQEAADGQTGELVAKQYIENVFPAVSRGEAREITADVSADSQKVEENTEGVSGTLLAMIDRTFPILGAEGKTEEPEIPAEKPAEPSQGTQEGETVAVLPKTEEPKEEKTTVPVLDTAESKKPLVLIVHTHATESYQPVSEGNFHSVNEAGTVREVGNELEKALEAKGIPVIHDKTLHDRPSYNQSYSRSLETVQNYLAKNPSIKIVIDLHRDAAAYSGNVGKTTTIEEKKVATYSLVIGKGNANVAKLRTFASKINGAADALYPGLADRVIDKEYRFNEYVCDQYMLLEIGNNENTIDQVKLTGKYFADILEKYIKENPQ